MAFAAMNPSAPTSLSTRLRSSARRGGYCLRAKEPLPRWTRKTPLLRPRPCTRSMASIGWPSRSAAASAAAARAGSAAIEDGRGDLRPARTVAIAAGSAAWGKKDARDPGRKARIGEYLLEIVDEVRAAERRDARQLAL